MQIMQHRMATEDVWDQSAYNMELWQPSRDAHFTGGCTIRVMSPLCFVNSKVRIGGGGFSHNPNPYPNPCLALAWSSAHTLAGRLGCSGTDEPPKCSRGVNSRQ
jgi:hypothetical protein